MYIYVYIDVNAYNFLFAMYNLLVYRIPYTTYCILFAVYCILYTRWDNTIWSSLV